MNSDPVFQPYLIPGESLRWSASVRVSSWKKFRPFFPAIGIFLGLFLLVLLSILSSGGAPHRQEPPPTTPTPVDTAGENSGKSGPKAIIPAIVVALFVSLFVTIWGAAMYNGLFREALKDQFSAPQSHYALTQHRLIWINGEKKRRIYSYPLVNMEHFRLDEHGDGTGDIYITLKPHGMHHPFNPPSYKAVQPVLLALPDAAQVYNLIFQAKMEAKS